MTEREEASALLDDVEGVEDRVRQFLAYASISHYLFLWGTIWAVGFTGSHFLRPHTDVLWWCLEAIGLTGTVLIARQHHRRVEGRNSFILWRAGLGVIATVAFGTLWIVIAHMGWREQVTFWPTLLSFMLFMFGMWVGRAVALAALAIFAISFLGYFVAGDYLHLWMAAATGGAMIAGGFWLRR